MLLIKKICKYTAYLVLGVLLYLLLSIVVSLFTANSDVKVAPLTQKTFYLDTNGVHLSIIIPVDLLSEEVKKGLPLQHHHKFMSFGWGDENFYLNTPTWNEFQFKYAFGAFFLNNPTAIHTKTYYRKRKDWVTVALDAEKLAKLNQYITNTFVLDSLGKKIEIPQQIYGKGNHFYKAKGSYSPAKTCNTWANNAFKESDLKACYWTLFDFGLMRKYE